MNITSEEPGIEKGGNIHTRGCILNAVLIFFFSFFLRRGGVALICLTPRNGFQLISDAIKPPTTRSVDRSREQPKVSRCFTNACISI